MDPHQLMSMPHLEMHKIADWALRLETATAVRQQRKTNASFKYAPDLFMDQRYSRFIDLFMRSCGNAAELL